MTLEDMKSSSCALVLTVLFLLSAVPSAFALDANSELVRSLARHVSRTFVVESPAVTSPLPSRAVAPLSATMPAAFAISPAPILPAPVEMLERATTPSSSKAFPILATTYVALNALDIYTTTKAVSSGRGVEANPILGSVASNPAALTAAKIATTAATLVIAKRLWKEHKTASIALMVAANIGTGFVVGHNAQVAGRF